jgi:hypothetical protein
MHSVNAAICLDPIELGDSNQVPFRILYEELDGTICHAGNAKVVAQIDLFTAAAAN